MRLSPHFTLGELTRSETATRFLIPNEPNPQQLANLEALCVQVLEKIRAHFDRPVRITSGFRSPEVNRRVGGSLKSQHMEGCAADLEVAGLDHRTVAAWIVEQLEFDQVILEFCTCHNNPETCHGWVHVSFRSRMQNRKALLRADHGRGVRYVTVSQLREAAA